MNLRHLDIPPVWTLGFLAANWALDRLLPVLAFAGGMSRTLAVVMVLAAVVLLVWSAILFRRMGTTIHPGGRPTALITRGPYRFTRNPIYLAMALVISAEALWLGSALPVLMVPLFVGVITTRFIAAEEQALREAFGEEAERYLAATRRWL